MATQYHIPPVYSITNLDAARRARYDDAMSESFRERVYALARKIPAGKVTTYGQLALLAGKPRAARLVGTLMMRCPDGNGVPCHRVIKSDGSLCGDPLWRMVQQTLLREEGCPFRLDGRVDLGRCRWGGEE